MDFLSVNKVWKMMSERVESWFELGVKNFPNFIVAILVLISFYIIARITRNAFSRVTHRSTKNIALQSLIANTVYLFIVTFGLFIALGILHLDKTVTSLLAGAGVIGLALGFAFQDITANFMSGILIAFKEPYKIGDIIEIEGVLGTVKSIDLRTTSIMSFDSIETFVPNKDMFTKHIKNFTTTSKRRLDIEVGVSYAEDLRKVEKLAKEAVKTLPGRVPSEPIELFYKEFGGSSINFDLRIWVNYPADNNFLKTRHEAIIRIKECFDANGISIPFPIRTLDFGIKGGEKLVEPLQAVFADAEH